MPFSDNAQHILRERYYAWIDGKQETEDEFIKRISMGNDEYESLLIRPNSFLPNSPTLFNLDVPSSGATLSACFKFDVSDTMLDGDSGIMDTATKAAMVTKWGGGVGYYVGGLRPKGALVNSTHGKAMGPVAVLRFYNSMGSMLTQSGKRNAAQMGILDCYHPDVREFIHMKDKDPQSLSTFNISVAISDEFMRKATSLPESDEAKLLDEIAQSAWRTGDPGVFYVDRAERDNPTPYLGKLSGTNPCGEVPLLNNEPCLVYDTLIDTTTGLRPIGSMVGLEGIALRITTEKGTVVEVPNSYVVERGIKPTIVVTLMSGQRIVGTENHRVFTKDGWTALGELSKNTWVRTQSESTVVPELGVEYPEDEMLGWFTGDGWLSKEDSCGIVFAKTDNEAYNKLKPIWDVFVGREYSEQTDSSGTRTIQCNKRSVVNKLVNDYGFSVATATNKTIPTYILTASAGQQAAFLRGLFGADGTIKKAGSGKRNVVNLATSSPDVAEKVQLLLARFGIVSRVTWSRFTTGRNPQAQVNITGHSAFKFLETIGFTESRKTNSFETGSSVNATRQYERVKAVEKGAEEPVFDIVMPAVHAFWAQGIMTHNCNLGSINLRNMWDGQQSFNRDLLISTTKLATRYLDDILDRNKFPVEAISTAALTTRKLGLGVCGWADLLALCKIPYASRDALDMLNEILSLMRRAADEESFRLGQEKGPAPALESASIKYRNATRLCIAPTGTIAILMGASSGIEPHYLRTWTRTLGDGTVLTESIPVLAEIGDFVPQTAMEIPWDWHVRHQAVAQQHVDLAVSKTINLPNDATVEDIRAAYIKMWETGCKGGTVYRDGCRSEQVLNTIVDMYEQVEAYDVKTQTEEVCPVCGAGIKHVEGCDECIAGCGWSACDV